MEASKSLIGVVFVMIMISSISTSESYVFSVGDRSGWVENPPVPYTNWAGSKRFLINDTLVFNDKGQDSVLVVTKQSYDSCNLSSPIQTLSGGNPVYKLDHSGPHYFISGAAGHCSNGQKMMVVVLSVKNKPVPSPPAPPTPSTPSPSPSPLATPTPSAHSPSPTPSTLSAPSPSPSPSTPTPSTPSPSPTPSTVIPSTPSPSSTPTASAPSAPSTATPESPPPPMTPSSSSVFRVSGVSMGLVALVLGTVLN